MLNEWTEFLQYTSPVSYTATGKRDNSYLGRFTYTTLTDFEGMARILTILARGYLFHDSDGNILDENPKDRIDLTHQALLAWCSIPDSKKATPKEEWQYRTDFREYSGEFPSLVDENGGGWFYRHVHVIIDFVRDNPALVSKTAQNNCEALANGFDKEWRNKVKQFQTPIFSRSTKGAWVLRFDDILADALELGALRKDEISLSDEDIQAVAALTPKDIPNEVIHTLIAYYRANKPEDSDWVVLPVASFDAYFGSTNFSHKWLVKIPDTILTREKQSFGVCRYKENI